eukprot:SM000172S03084  [mRNA]  locus=s172:193184:196341:+ [translate_table: standard]
MASSLFPLHPCQRLAPRLLQAAMAAVGDLHLHRLAARLHGQRAADWALACQLASWFTLFCSTRTFSSCAEAALTTAGLALWPWPRAAVGVQPHDDRRALRLAALACAARPTAAIPWAFAGARRLLGLDAAAAARFVASKVLPVALVALVGTVALDSWMYGRPVAVPLEFLRFNVLAGGAAAYGTHPWHWYFSQGFPVMLGTLLPLAALGAWWSPERGPAWLVLWTLACYSPLAHKEFRFVLPVLPLAIMYAGHALAVLEARSWTAAGRRRQDAGAAAAAELQARPALTTEAGTVKSDGSSVQRLPAGPHFWSRPFAACVAALFATQIIPGLYFSVVHQRGSVVVMDYLSREAGAGRVAAVTFLMPCHSTPFYSHLHRNVPMNYLDCSPRGLEAGASDSTAFLANPGSFVRRLYRNETTMPSHLVLFDVEEPKLRDFLQERGYSEARRFFHAHFPVDRELQNYVLVYTRTMRRK